MVVYGLQLMVYGYFIGRLEMGALRFYQFTA